MLQVQLGSNLKHPRQGRKYSYCFLSFSTSLQINYLQPKGPLSFSIFTVIFPIVKAMLFYSPRYGRKEFQCHGLTAAFQPAIPKISAPYRIALASGAMLPSFRRFLLSQGLGGVIGRWCQGAEVINALERFTHSTVLNKMSSGIPVDVYCRQPMQDSISGTEFCVA